MRVDEDKCIGCLECVDYCPVGAIERVSGGIVAVNQDECVECGVCRRVGVCDNEALWQPRLEWPRILRAQFSNPRMSHPSTSVRGRGTEESKTNDVTGKYPPGYIAIAAELGRPGIGTRLEEVEKVAQAILPLGVQFEEDNPTYPLFADIASGRLRDDVRDEKVLSAILEFTTSEQKAPEVLKALADIAGKLDTVVTMNIGSVTASDGSLPAEKAAREAGLEIRPNGKTNLGLGRPLAKSAAGGE